MPPPNNLSLSLVLIPVGLVPPPSILVSGRKLLMSRTLQTCFAGLSAILFLGAVSLQPAAARILCQGEFQVTQYGTPHPTAGMRRLRGSHVAIGGEKPLRSTPTL